jgi:hypothetical protein
MPSRTPHDLADPPAARGSDPRPHLGRVRRMAPVRVDDAQVRTFDPYVDARLDAEALTRWLSAPAGAVSARRRETEAGLRATHQLPRDTTARDLLLAEWVARELADDAHYRTLLELEATITLALETGARVDTIGD